MWSPARATRAHPGGRSPRPLPGARVAVERALRGGAPRERRLALATARDEALGERAIVEQLHESTSDVGDVERIEVVRGVTGNLRERGGARAGDGNAAAHGLENRDAEALVDRGEHEA